MIQVGLLSWVIHLTGHSSHRQRGIHPMCIYPKGVLSEGHSFHWALIPGGDPGSFIPWCIHPTGHSSHGSFIPSGIHHRGGGSFCIIWGALIPLSIDIRWIHPMGHLSHGAFPKDIHRKGVSFKGFHPRVIRSRGIDPRAVHPNGHWSHRAFIPLGIHPMGHGSSGALIPRGFYPRGINSAG